LEEILLDRARGYVVSVNDPATAAGHCAIGGGEYDFLVTSTLSSQALPAVGRALGNSLAHLLKIQKPKFQKDMISFVRYIYSNSL
jgi:histidyl-tRNA synthetase